MRPALSFIAAAIVTLATLAPAFAHDGHSHPKCKKGYVETDDHRCVKKQ